MTQFGYAVDRLKSRPTSVVYPSSLCRAYYSLVQRTSARILLLARAKAPQAASDENADDFPPLDPAHDHQQLPLYNTQRTAVSPRAR